MFKEKNVPSYGKEKEEEEDAIVSAFCPYTHNFFCSDDPRVQIPTHDLHNLVSAPRILDHGKIRTEKKQSGEEEEPEASVSPSSEYGWVGVMLFLWFNKV